jgi:hypothetical protein
MIDDNSVSCGCDGIPRVLEKASATSFVDGLIFTPGGSTGNGTGDVVEGGGSGAESVSRMNSPSLIDWNVTAERGSFWRLCRAGGGGIESTALVPIVILSTVNVDGTLSSAMLDTGIAAVSDADRFMVGLLFVDSFDFGSFEF